jgi:hypothetical protein
VRSRHNARRDEAYLVTEARQSRSAEIGQRERRYLTMMSIRVVCFVVTVVLFVNHAGWFTVIPAAGAIALPYFAVVVANARREVGVGQGFREYEPRLPERYVRPGESDPRQPGPRPGEADGAQPGSSPPGPGQPGRGEPGSGQFGRGEPGSGQFGRGEPGSGQSGRGEPGSGQSGRGEPGSGQPGPAAPSGPSAGDDPTPSP